MHKCMLHAAVAEEADRYWKYRSWQQLEGYPYWGQMATYSGGGYVASLGRSNMREHT